MVLHHVLQRADAVIIGNTAFEAHRLGDGDLDMVDRLRVPQRLEEHVGKAQRQQVLHRFLAEIVVDAEDAVFGKGIADLRIHVARRSEVVADRLFHRDAAFGAGDAGGLEPFRDRTEHRRRGREIDADRAAHAVAEQRRKLVITRARAGIDRAIIDAVEEGRDARIIHAISRQMLGQRIAHLLLKRRAVHLRAPRSNNRQRVGKQSVEVEIVK